MSTASSSTATVNSIVALLTSKGSRFGEFDSEVLLRIVTTHFDHEQLKDEESFLQMITVFLLIKHGGIRFGKNRKWLSLISGGEVAMSDYWIDWKILAHYMHEAGFTLNALQNAAEAPSFIPNAAYRMMHDQEIHTDVFLEIVKDLHAIIKMTAYEWTHEDIPTDIEQSQWMHAMLPAIWAVDATSATYLSSNTDQGTGNKVQGGTVTRSEIRTVQSSYFFGNLLPKCCLFIVGGPCGYVTILKRDASKDDIKRASELNFFLELLSQQAQKVEKEEPQAELHEVVAMAEIDDTCRAIPNCSSKAVELSQRSSVASMARSRILELKTGIICSQAELDSTEAQEQELLAKLAEVRRKKTDAATALRTAETSLAETDIPALAQAIVDLNQEIGKFNQGVEKVKAAASNF